MIKKRLSVGWSLFLLPFFALSALATESEDKETRHLAATVYFNCLSSEGARILTVSPRTKPNQFERIAATKCKEDEERLRQLMQIDVLLPQVQQKQFLNKEAQAVLLEAIEQTVTGLRRSVVVIYAEEFDKRNPGLRSCSLTSAPQTDKRLKYLCAVRD
jgi:predicted ATP-dependent protease